MTTMRINYIWVRMAFAIAIVISAVSNAEAGTIYTYDDNGNISSYIYPNGVLTSFTYDVRDQIKTVNISRGGSQIASYTYTRDPMGRIKTVSEFSGRTVLYEYDNAGRLVAERISNDPPGNSGQISYEHDASGNRTKRVSIISGISTEIYNYDANDKLDGEIYDANGNVTQTGGRTLQYNSLNELVGANGGQVRYGYNGLGHLVTKTANGETTAFLVIGPPPEIEYSSNDDGELEDILSEFDDFSQNVAPSPMPPRRHTIQNVTSDIIAQSLGNSHNTIQQRGPISNMNMNSGATASNPMHSVRAFGVPQSVQELISRSGGMESFETKRTYIYGNHLISQRNEQTGKTHYYGYDGLGNVRFLLNEDGYVTDRYDYDAFGNLIYRSGTTENNHLFAGEWFDPDLGFYYLRARHYNPATGRFIQRDPLEASMDDAREGIYFYALGDPVNFIDPTGTISLVELKINIGIRALQIGRAIPYFGRAFSTVRVLGLRNLTIQQLKSRIAGTQKQLLNQWMGNGIQGAQTALQNINVPANITRQTLEVYREIALRAIQAGKDKGAQALRLELMEKALRIIP